MIITSLQLLLYLLVLLKVIATTGDVEDAYAVINCTCTIYKSFLFHAYKDSVNDSIDDDKYVTFHYYGIQSYFKTGAITFCMNELSLVYSNVEQVFDIHNSCIEISDKLVNASKCEKGLNFTGLVYGEYGKSSDVSSLKVARAVIVEPRNHVALRTVLHNVCDSLHIPITIFHGLFNIALVNSIYKECQCIDQMVNMGVDDLDGDSYNSLLLSDYDFWSQINTPDHDSVLIFQTDSGICEQSHSHLSINLFEQYHYCGGLFHYIQMLNTSLVGNGGFSIRHKGVMRKLLELNPDKRTHFYWEDALYSFWCLKDPNCRICPEDISQLFANTGSPLSIRALYQLDGGHKMHLHKSILIDMPANPLLDVLSPDEVNHMQHIPSWGFHKNWKMSVDETELIQADSSPQYIGSAYRHYDFDSDFLVCPINREIMQLNSMQEQLDGE